MCMCEICNFYFRQFQVVCTFIELWERRLCGGGGGGGSSIFYPVAGFVILPFTNSVSLQQSQYSKFVFLHTVQSCTCLGEVSCVVLGHTLSVSWCPPLLFCTGDVTFVHGFNFCRSCVDTMSSLSWMLFVIKHRLTSPGC
jgi:hypothetical protein